MFWQLQGRVTSAVACDEERVNKVHWCQQHIYPNTHPSLSKDRDVWDTARLGFSVSQKHVLCTYIWAKKKKKSQFLWRVSKHLVLTVHLSMWVLGNARTALTGRRVLGKGKKQKSGFSLENKQTFVSEEREKTVCLTGFSGSGWGRDGFKQWPKVFNDPTSLIKLSKYEDIILYF